MMPNDDQSHDPMRELDLLLLEDLKMRRNFQPTKAARALQTAGMVLVLLGVGVIFAYSLRHPEVGTVARLKDTGPHLSLSIPVP